MFKGLGFVHEGLQHFRCTCNDVLRDIMFVEVRNTKSLPIYVDIVGRPSARNLWAQNQPCWASWKRLATTRPSSETSSVHVSI